MLTLYALLCAVRCQFEGLRHAVHRVLQQRRGDALLIGTLRERQHDTLVQLSETESSFQIADKQVEALQGQFRRLHSKHADLEALYRWEKNRNAALEQRHDDTKAELRQAKAQLHQLRDERGRERMWPAQQQRAMENDELSGQRSKREGVEGNGQASKEDPWGARVAPLSTIGSSPKRPRVHHESASFSSPRIPRLSSASAHLG